MLNIRGLLLAGIDSFGRLSSEKWNLLVRAVRELQEIGDYGMTVEKFQKLLQKYASPMFLSKQKDDFTRFLIYFYSGLIADKFIKSNDFKHGQWGKDDNGRDRNDGVGFSIFKDDVNTWTIELDYAIIRQLLRAKELYTEKAHIGQVSNQTVFLVGLQTLGNILLGEYAEGVQGGILTPDGDAELRKLVTRGLAKLAELYVVGDSTFGGSLSSVEFISSFLGGKGWAIQKKTRINAAGVEEEYYTLEIDSVTVRETLRVYEMIISQLRGEFDNYVFAAMMEVHHYDAATGKVWLSTEGGRIKAVSFRQGDYIKVQQFQPGNDVVSGGDGYITKTYELIVTDSGTGGQEDENGDRLDWVTFKNFTTSMENETAASLITKKDTFVRIDNETDPERKGLMQIITVGPNTPYQDVFYGLKTDPNDALKLRLGNLQGVRTDIFGWLESYGAYVPNFYGVGKMFNRQTGESLNSSIEITRERLKSVYTETTFNISDEENFLKNGFFTKDLENWTVCATDGGAAPSGLSTGVINSGDGTPLMVNGAVLSYQSRLTAEVTDYDGMRVLHLLGMGVYQSFTDIKANETHKENKSDNDQNEGYTQTKDVANRLYLGIRILPVTTGTLKVQFMRQSGSVIAEWSKQLNASREWQLEQTMDSDASPWAYTGQQGRMIVSYTGNCYVRFVALRTDPVVNSRETYETMIEQTSRRITLEAAKQTADLNREVARIDIAYNKITSTVTNNWDRTKTAFEKLGADLTKSGEELAAQYGILATFKAQTDATILSVAANFDEAGNIKAGSKVRQEFNNISSTVTNNWEAADLAFQALGLSWDSNKEEYDSASYATWKTQTDSRTASWAAAFDTNGKLARYSEVVQGYDALTTRLTDFTKDNYSTVLQKCGIISGSVQSYDAKLSSKADTSALDNYEPKVNWTDKLSGYATGSDLTQTSNSLTAKIQKVAQKGIAITETEWELGNTTNENQGQQWGASMKTNSNTKLRTKRLIGVTTLTRITLNSNYRAGFVYFDKNEKVTAQEWSGWKSPDSNGLISVGAASNVAYVIILIKRSNDGNISTSEVVDAEIGISSDTVVTQGEISLFLEDKDSVTISHAKVSADCLDFHFTKSTSFYANGTEVMNLDTHGNLWIKGDYAGGNITGNIAIGTGTKRMYIEPTETGARLIGKDGDNTTLVLGFYSFNGQIISLLQVNRVVCEGVTTNMLDGSGLSDNELRLYSLGNISGGLQYKHVVILRTVDGALDFRVTDGGETGCMWPTSSSSVKVGGVYRDGDVLKVRTS